MFLGLKPIMLCDSSYVIKKKTGDGRKKHFGDNTDVLSQKYLDLTFPFPFQLVRTEQILVQLQTSLTVYFRVIFYTTESTHTIKYTV